MKNRMRRRTRLYISDEGQSGLIDDIVPKKVTIDLSKGIFSKSSKGTIFREIKTVAYEKIYKKIKGRKGDLISKKGLAEAAFAEFMRGIESIWSSAKFHIIMHSSGYDSRLIALAVKRLYEKNGSTWLGPVIFVEADGEACVFKELMKLEGWNKSQYVVYNEGAKTSEYHENSFDFVDAWKRLNGARGLPFNLWWEPIEWLQNRGLFPKDSDIQCFSGWGRNEIEGFLSKGKGLNDYFSTVYYSAANSVPLKVRDWVLPFYNLDFWGLFINNNWTSWPSTSHFLLKKLEPTWLRFRNVEHVEIRASVRIISERLLNKTIKDYERSWFGRTFGLIVEPVNKIVHSDWWGIWSLASFCEHLLQKGHKIQVNPFK